MHEGQHFANNSLFNLKDLVQLKKNKKYIFWLPYKIYPPTSKNSNIKNRI